MTHWVAVAPLRRRRRDGDFDFKRSAAELRDDGAEPWFLADDPPAAEAAPDIDAGRSARFDADDEDVAGT